MYWVFSLLPLNKPLHTFGSTPTISLNTVQHTKPTKPNCFREFLRTMNGIILSQQHGRYHLTKYRQKIRAQPNFCDYSGFYLQMAYRRTFSFKDGRACPLT